MPHSQNSSTAWAITLNPRKQLQAMVDYVNANESPVEPLIVPDMGEDGDYAAINQLFNGGVTNLDNWIGSDTNQVEDFNGTNGAGVGFELQATTVDVE